MQLHDYVGSGLIETWNNGTWLRHNNLCSHTVQTIVEFQVKQIFCIIVRLKRDGTCTETRFRLSPKQTSPFKLAGASVQLIAGSRGVHISVSNAGYATF